MYDGFRRKARGSGWRRTRPRLTALHAWYQDAVVVIDNFDASVAIIRSMLGGDPAANLRIATSLSALLSESEIWLLSHPCPDRWNGEYLLDVVGVFVEIGQDLVRAGGDPAIVPGDLALELDVATDLLAHVKELADQVASAVRG